MAWIECGRVACYVEKVGRRKAITAIDLSGFTNREIAGGVGWNGDPDRLIDAMIQSGFMTPEKMLLGSGLMMGFIEGVTHQSESVKAARMRRAPREAVFARDEYMCVYCGSSENLTLDHIVPYSRGGDESPENLVACCRSCNSRKGARTPEEAGFTGVSDHA